MKSDLTAPESALPQALVTGDHVLRAGMVQGDPNTGYLSEGGDSTVLTAGGGHRGARARLCVCARAREGGWPGLLGWRALLCGSGFGTLPL